MDLIQRNGMFTLDDLPAQPLRFGVKIDVTDHPGHTVMITQLPNNGPYHTTKFLVQLKQGKRLVRKATVGYYPRVTLTIDPNEEIFPATERFEPLMQLLPKVTVRFVEGDFKTDETLDELHISCDGTTESKHESAGTVLEERYFLVQGGTYAITYDHYTRRIHRVFLRPNADLETVLAAVREIRLK